MLERKISEVIERFYRTNNGALLISGARQTGKTYSIRRFAETHFQSFLEINFVEMPDAVDIFSNVSNRNDILLRLSAMTDKPLVPGETLVFFDEVQLCPEIVTAIKFLVDEGSYRYIMSGSLLGVELNNLRSVPVGYMAIEEMYPLDFEEFLWAIGVNKEIVSKLQAAWNDKTPVDGFIHRRMLEILRLYLIIGGMPSAVMAYKVSNNLQDVFASQREIIGLYRKDISQYDESKRLKIKEIFDLIPSELNSKNKRFFMKSISAKSRAEMYEDEFLWLKNAGVALPVYNIEEPKSPLALSRSRNLFKLFSSDVGLLSCQYSDGLQLKILSGNDTMNFGSIYENFVAQELSAHGFENLFYFNSKKQGEVDFVIEHDSEVLPIEVKSGKDYTRHRALNNILDCPDYSIPEALVFCNDNLSQSGKIIYAPAYMIMFLHKASLCDIHYTIDLEGLR